MSRVWIIRENVDRGEKKPIKICEEIIHTKQTKKRSLSYKEDLGNIK